MHNVLSSFKVKHGTAAQLFDANGIIRPNVKLELGSWYICTDTASVYICISENSKLRLRRINSESFEFIDAKIDNLTARVEQVEKNTVDYIKINSEDELPNDFSSFDFNPNNIYYIEVDSENHYIDTYVFDAATNRYLCSKGSKSQTEGPADLDAAINLIHGGGANG